MADLVGDAYVRLHLRGNERAMHRAVKQMGERAGKDFASEFDKMVANASEGRLKKSLQQMADAIVDVDFRKMRREGERLEHTHRRLNSVFDNWVKTQKISTEEAEKYKTALRDWVGMERERERSLRASIKSLGESTKGLNDISQLEDALAKARKKHADAAKRAYADDLDQIKAREAEMAKAHKAQQKRLDEAEKKYRRFGDQMKAVDRALIASFARVMNENHAKRWDDMVIKGERLDEAYERLSRTVRRLGDEQEINIDTQRRVTRSLDDWHKSMRGAQTTAKEFQKILGDKKTWDDMRRGSESVEDAFRRLSGRIEEAGRASRITSKDQGRLTQSLQAWKVELDKGDNAWRRFTRGVRRGIGDQAPHFERMERSLGRTRRHIQRMPDLMGKIGGRGARNDFINLIGVFTRGIGSLLTLFPRLAAAGAEAFAGLGRNMSEAARSGQSLANVLISALAGALINLPLMLGGIVVALAAMAVALPAVVSLLSLLAGTLVVVAGALSYGLIGSLLVLGPLLLGLGAMIAAIVIGFKSWGDASDATKAKLDPLISAWNDLQETFRSDLLPKAAAELGGLGSVVRDFVTPMLVGMGEAVIDIIGHLGRVMRAKETKAFLSLWEEQLPKVMSAFGTGLADLLVGLLAFFTPILDYTQRMADGFADAMETFRKWASSAKGQNSIAEFMEKAWKAATDLWGVVKSIGTLFRELFAISWESGGGATFLENLERGIRGITDWIRNNKDVVQGWFEDVENFMTGLGDFLKGIFGSGGLWDQLDNADMRDLIGDFLKGFGEIDWSGIGASVGEVVEAFKELVTDVDWVKLINGISDAGVALGDFMDGWADGEGIAGKIREEVESIIKIFDDFIYEMDRMLTAIGQGDVLTGTSFDLEKELRYKMQQAGIAAGEGGLIIGAKLGAAISSGVDESDYGLIGQRLGDDLKWDTAPMLARIGAGLGAELGKSFVVEVGNTTSGTSSRFESAVNEVDPTSLSNKIGEWIGLARDNATTKVEEMNARIRNLIATLPDSMRETGAGIGTALGAGLGGLGAVIEDNLRDVPSKLTGPFGMATAGVSFELLSLASGVRSNLRDVASSVSTELSTVPDAMTSVMQQMRTAAITESAGTATDIGTSLGGVAPTVTATLGSAVEAARVAMTTMRATAAIESAGTALDIGASLGAVAPTVSDALQPAVQTARAKMIETRAAAIMEAAQMAPGVSTEASKVAPSVSSALAAVQGVVKVQMVAASLAAKLETVKMHNDVKAESAKIPGALTSSLAQSAAMVRVQLVAASLAAKVAMVTMTTSIRAEASRVPGILSSALAPMVGVVASRMSAAVSVARSGAQGIVSAIRSGAAGAAGALSAALSGLAGAVASQMGRALATARSMAAAIRSAISAASGTIRISAVSSRRAMASGGVVRGATNALIGEAGAEAVVPLQRPLALVDPAVRDLAAYAQGKSTGREGPRTVVESGAIVVHTTQRNEAQIAAAALDRLVAMVAN